MKKRRTDPSIIIKTQVALKWFPHVVFRCRKTVSELLCLARQSTGMHALTLYRNVTVIHTVQGRPSTVVSLKDWPTVKETLVVRTLVDVLMDRLSSCWVISTAGLEAAVTAIFLRNTFTPEPRGTKEKHKLYEIGSWGRLCRLCII